MLTRKWILQGWCWRFSDSTIENAGSETIGDTGRDGKAPEVSPEEETSSGSSRLAGTRMFLWSVYSRVASNWDFSTQDRTTGRIFDSTKGYPGEGPDNGDDFSSKRNLPWISEDYLDEVVSKKLERSSDMDGLDGFVPESEGQSEKRWRMLLPLEFLWLFGKRDIELGIGGCVVRMYLDARLEQ